MNTENLWKVAGALALVSAGADCFALEKELPAPGTDAKAPSLHCSFQGKAYSPGAVVRHAGVDLRCTKVYPGSLESSPVLAWVPLSDELKTLK